MTQKRFAAKKTNMHVAARNVTSLVEAALVRRIEPPTFEENSMIMGTMRIARYDGFTNEDVPPIDIHPKIMAKSFFNLPVWVNSLKAAKDNGAVA
jgi:hypothetical protein